MIPGAFTADEQNEAKADPRPPADSEATARNLEEKADAIRDDLGELVGELDRRRHRAVKPIGIAAVALVGVVVGSVVFFQIRRRRTATVAFPLRLPGLARAAGRIVAQKRERSRRPPAMQKKQPSATNRILVAAGATLASVLTRYVAQRLLSVGSGPGRPRTSP